MAPAVQPWPDEKSCRRVLDWCACFGGCAGAWAQSVLHPSAGITKEYVVTCDTEPSRKQLEVIAAGCEVEGAFVQPLAVAPVVEAGQKPRVRVVVAEGRKHEVRCPLFFVLLASQPQLLALKAPLVLLVPPEGAAHPSIHGTHLMDARA
jgi:hypothetical protein